MLNLFLTNRPNILQNMPTLPGISDHDILIADYDINLNYNKKHSRKIYIFKNADWENITNETTNFRDQFL